MLEKVKFILSEIEAVNDEPKAQPGTTESRIISAFEKIGVVPPSYLVELYKWHDGIWNVNAFLSLNSLEESLSIYAAFCEMGESWEDCGWSPTWFPVMNMNGDLHYCIDLESGLLSVIDPEGGTVETLAPEVEKFIDALVEVFETKSFAFEPFAGTVEVGKPIWRAIAAKHGL